MDTRALSCDVLHVRSGNFGIAVSRLQGNGTVGVRLPGIGRTNAVSRTRETSTETIVAFLVPKKVSYLAVKTSRKGSLYVMCIATGSLTFGM